MTGVHLLPLIAATAVMTLLGFFATALLARRVLSSRLIWALAPGVGGGICSLIFFVFRRPMFTVEFALLIALSAAWFVRQGRLARLGSLISWKPPGFSLLLAGALGLAMAGWVARVDRVPHGEWDGWAIWNSHARFLYRDGPHWRKDMPGAVNGELNTFHPDYPLLTPSLTARFWRYAGESMPEAGAAVGIILALSGVAVIGTVLAELRDSSIGMLMALVLLGSPLYLYYATAQYADLPMSFFVLGAIAMLCVHFERAPDHFGLLVIAGFMAGCAGWTKNEGLLFTVAASAVLLSHVLLRRSSASRRLLAFCTGLLPPLAVTIFFKLMIAPQSDLTSNRHYGEIVEKIMNGGRYVTIFKTFVSTGWSFGQLAVPPLILLAVFVTLRGIDRQALRNLGWLTSFAILGITLAGYFAVYVVTPMDLSWHLSSSLDRLMLHLWPSFLLVVALAGRAETIVDRHG